MKNLLLFKRRMVSFLLMFLIPGVCLMTAETQESKKEKPLFIILFGAPGSGKGTQADLLSSHYRFVHISTGDMFRENMKNNTPVGKKAKEYMEKGELVPDSIVIEMLQNRLQQPDCAQGILLDGFPRNVAQANALEKVLQEYHLLVLSYEISDASVIKRISGRRSCPACNKVYNIYFNPPKEKDTCDVCHTPLITRSDDTEEVVKKRLEVFHAQTSPVKAYYEKKGILYSIDAEEKPEAISEKTFALINPHYVEQK